MLGALGRGAIGAGDVPSRGGWLATLDVSLSTAAHRTYVESRRHRGPLVMQRAFPEPDGGCQIYLVHPPGGVAGGDELRVTVRCRSGARGLLTTPAATKLYRTEQQPSRIEQRFHVASGASLEWLPQETIAYEGARSSLRTRVDLEGGGHFVGLEVFCLGQAGRGVGSGHFEPSWELWREQELLFWERGRYGALEIQGAAWGLAGAPVFGTFVCTGGSDELVRALRDLLGARPGGSFSVTRLGEAIVVRFLGEGAEAALAGFRAAWAKIRPAVLGRAAVLPRVWAT